VVVREGGVTPPTPMHSFLQQASGQIFKDDVNDFSSTSDICFMVAQNSQHFKSLFQGRVRGVGKPMKKIRKIGDNFLYVFISLDTKRKISRRNFVTSAKSLFGKTIRP
jgi:hypothetical protein